MAEIPEIFSSAGNVDLGQPKESLSSEHEFGRSARWSREGPTLSGELTESIVKKKGKGGTFSHSRKAPLIKRFLSNAIILLRKSWSRKEISDSPFRDSAKDKQKMEQSEFHEESSAAGETSTETDDSVHDGDDALTEDFDTGIPPHYKESGPLRDSQPQTMQNFIDTLREDKELGKEPTAAAETFGDTEKPILGDELTEEFDIGIPPHYKESGPLRDSQRQIMQSFIDALREDMELGKGFFNVLDSIKVLTSVLVGLHAPLADWNSLAQYVLREVRRIENVRRKHEGEGYQKTRSLSSVQAKFEECRATVGEDSAKLGELKENLISLEQEHASSTSRFEDLQKQLVDLQNQMEDLEGTLNLSQDKVDAISHWRRQNIERIEYLELAILTLHESLLSRFSSSDFGGKITQSSDVRNSGKKEMLPDAAHLLHLERQTKVEMP